MEITIQYTGQLANLTGTSEETANLKVGTTLSQLITQLVKRHGDGYSDLLLTRDGSIRPSVLVILDGEQAEGTLETLTFEGVKTVMLMTPIAGG
jgi:molybdopterin converting factor small subunit